MNDGCDAGSWLRSNRAHAISVAERLVDNTGNRVHVGPLDDFEAGIVVDEDDSGDNGDNGGDDGSGSKR